MTDTKIGMERRKFIGTAVAVRCNQQLSTHCMAGAGKVMRVGMPNLTIGLKNGT